MLRTLQCHPPAGRQGFTYSWRYQPIAPAIRHAVPKRPWRKSSGLEQDSMKSLIRTTRPLEENGASGASAAFGGSSSLSSVGYYTERTVHCLAVRKQGSEIGLNHHQVGSGGRPAIVLASNAAPQLREIILRSKVITWFSYRFLLHTVFARSALQGAH